MLIFRNKMSFSSLLANADLLRLKVAIKAKMTCLRELQEACSRNQTSPKPGGSCFAGERDLITSTN